MTLLASGFGLVQSQLLWLSGKRISIWKNFLSVLTLTFKYILKIFFFNVKDQLLFYKIRKIDFA